MKPFHSWTRHITFYISLHRENCSVFMKYLPRSIAFFSHLSWPILLYLSCVSCVHCPVVFKPCLMLASLRGIDLQAKRLWGLAVTITEELLCRSWPYGSGLTSVGLWSSPSQPLECFTPGGDRVVIWHAWSWPPCAVTLPRAPSMSCKAICIWLLFLLGLEVRRRSQAVNQGRLPLVLGLGPPT